MHKADVNDIILFYQVIQVAAASDKKLVSRDEKVQVNALRKFYSQ